MSDQGACEWCGGPIPPRSDPRGQRARFCRPAHRAAAHRARAQTQHDAEVEGARQQMVLPTEPTPPTSEQRLEEAIATFEAVSATVDRGVFPDRLPDLITAAMGLLDAAYRQDYRLPEGEPTMYTPLSSQRRAAQRQAKKKR